MIVLGVLELLCFSSTIVNCIVAVMRSTKESRTRSQTHVRRSPPRSMPKPLLRLLRVMVGLVTGGMSLSKSNLRLAEAPGVLPATGVRFQCPCPGEGVTLMKSLKSNLTPGVLGPKPRNPLPAVPGVMCEDGRGVDLQGGVLGG